MTGACLATRREVFDELEGFDETLGVDLNDVDYCLRAGVRRATGRSTSRRPNWSTTSRRAGEPPVGWATSSASSIAGRVTLPRGIRYFNPHLTRADPSCGLAGAEEEDAWNQWHSTLTMQ